MPNVVLLGLASGLLWWPVAPLVCAQDQSLPVETVADQLRDPTSVVIQPGTGHPFVADVGLPGVVRWSGEAWEPVIIHAQDGAEGGQAGDAIQCLAWLSPQMLAVGTRGSESERGAVRLFQVPPVGGEPLMIDQPASELPDWPNEEGVGAESIVALIGQEQTLVVASVTEQGQAGLTRASPGEDGAWGSSHRLWSGISKSPAASPSALAFSPEGHVVICHAGDSEDAARCRLTFVALDGTSLESFELSLAGWVGLAYHRPSGWLLGLMGQDHDQHPAGLYRIVAETPERGRAVLLAKVDQPTAMTVAPNGDVWITDAGPVSSEPTQANGRLAVIRAAAFEVLR